MPTFRLAILLLSIIVSGMVSPKAQSITGTAKAIDGDTIDMTGQKVRLRGIDAPELRQTCQRDSVIWPCGAQARDQLASMLTGRDVQCDGDGAAAGDILTARCRADGADLAEAMVASSFATVTVGGEADYGAMAARVQKRKSGIWAGPFDLPQAWRVAHPEAVAKGRPESRNATRVPSRKVYRDTLGCTVKGNYSRRLREYVYYLPGMKYYDGTRPEMVFCTEAEAQAAGFRRSRGG